MSDKKKKSRVGSIIFRIVLIIIAGLTVGIGVFSWNASGLLGNQLPMPFGFGVSVVMSPSMEPVLHTNDLVFVTEQDSYEVDDIVVYQEGNMLVIHRIVSIDGDKVITKGDANNVADDAIAMDDIKAKLSFRIPFIGLIFKYLKTVPGTLLVLALAIFLLYRSRQKERDADKEELEDIYQEIKRLRQQQEERAALVAASQTEDEQKSSADAGSADAEDVRTQEQNAPENSSEMAEQEKETSKEPAQTEQEEQAVPEKPAEEAAVEQEAPEEPAGEEDAKADS